MQSADDLLSCDKFVISCNFAVGNSVHQLGGAAYLSLLFNSGSTPNKILITARSRGGRWVQRWHNISELTDFRAKTIPMQHPFYSDERIASLPQKEDASKLAEFFQVRSDLLRNNKEGRTEI